MIPKKADTLIKPTASATNTDPQLVEDLISFFWGDVRKALVDLKSHNIYVESFGTFRLKTWKLAETEENLCNLINHYTKLQESEKMTFQRFSILKELQDRHQKIQAVKEMIAKDLIKKQEVIDKRNARKNLEK